MYPVPHLRTGSRRSKWGMQTEPGTPPPTSKQAIWSLVLGVLGIFCLWMLGSIPAIVLGGLAIRKINASHGSLGGRGLAVAGICTGSVGVLTGAVSAIIAVSILLPALNMERQQAEVTLNEARIRDLTTACLAYTMDHGGSFPADLETLVGEDYLENEDTLLWRGGSESEGKPYRYFAVGEITGIQSPDTTPLVATPEPLHGRRVVGFCDTHVESVTEEEYQTRFGERSGP